MKKILISGVALFAVAAMSGSVSKADQTAKPVTSNLVEQVINGDFGNGEARKASLEKAGYSYETVQQKVNEELQQQTSTQAVPVESNPQNSTPVPSNSSNAVAPSNPVSRPVTSEPTKPAAQSASSQTNSGSVSAGQFQTQGVIYANGYRYTYYNLPMGGVEAMHGVTFHDRGDGVLVDPSGYVVVAYGMAGYGQIIPTPMGTGKVYDHCPEGAVDVAVTW